MPARKERVPGPREGELDTTNDEHVLVARELARELGDELSRVLNP